MGFLRACSLGIRKAGEPAFLCSHLLFFFPFDLRIRGRGFGGENGGRLGLLYGRAAAKIVNALWA